MADVRGDDHSKKPFFIRGGKNRQKRSGPFRSRDDRKDLGPSQPAAKTRVVFHSSSSSFERSDPLWVAGLDNCYLHPTVGVGRIYPSAEFLPRITSVIHAQLLASSSAYDRHVPESALCYYCAVFVYARMLRVGMNSGVGVNANEREFVWQVESLNYEIPGLLAHYLSAFGSFQERDGRFLEFSMLKRNYVDTEAIRGWFGRVSVETQPLYQNYPCLAVYAQRMCFDASDDEFNPEWTLPPGFEPEFAVGADMDKPSEAMLGYKSRANLSNTQKHFLHSAGIHMDQFTSAHGCIAYNTSVMYQLQEILNNASALRRVAPPSSIIGSLAQFSWVRYVHEAEDDAGSTDPVIMAESGRKYGAEICAVGLAFGYRVSHPDAAATSVGVRRRWVVWDVEDDPGEGYAALAQAGNHLRTLEPAIINTAEFESTLVNSRTQIELLNNAVGKNFEKVCEACYITLNKTPIYGENGSISLGGVRIDGEKAAAEVEQISEKKHNKRKKSKHDTEYGERNRN